MNNKINCKQNKLSMADDKRVKNMLTTNYAVSDERLRSDGEQIPYWGGILFKSGKGGKGGRGFSTLGQESFSAIGGNTPTTSTTPTEFCKSQRELENE